MSKQEGRAQEVKESLPKVNVWIRERYTEKLPDQPTEVFQEELVMEDGEPVLKFVLREHGDTYKARYKDQRWEADALD